MTTKKERDAYEAATRSIIKEASGDNPFAFDYLWKLSCISRTVDDVFDGDQPLKRDAILTSIQYLLIELPFNPFFEVNRKTLQSQHLSMYNAWMAANAWEDGDETERIYSHVWRDTYHEIVPIVALLTQGPGKMKEVSVKIRTLFKKKLGE